MSRLRLVGTLLGAFACASMIVAPTLAFAKSGGGSSSSSSSSSTSRGGGGGFGGNSGGFGRSTSSPTISAPARTSSPPAASPSFGSKPGGSSAPSAAPAAHAPAAPTFGTKPGQAPAAQPAVAPQPQAPTFGAKPGVGTGIAVGVGVGAVGAAAASQGDKPSTDSKSGHPASPSAPTFGAKPGQATAPTQPSAPAFGQKPGQGTQQAATPSAAQPAVIPAKRTALDQAVAGKRSTEALAAFRQEQQKEQAKFAAPPPRIDPQVVRNNPVVSDYRPAQRVEVRTYYINRDRYYDSYGWNRPSYVGWGAPSYGAWDAVYLAWAMNHNPAFFYHHYDDPGVIAYRREMQRIADEKNSDDLKRQIAELDRKVTEQSGPRNKKYLPDGIKPDVALSAEAVTGTTVPKLRFATGVAGTTYSAICEGNNDLRGFDKITGQAMDVECINTGGAFENIEGFAMGRFDAIIASADVMDFGLSTGKIKSFGEGQMVAYHETMWLAVNRDSGIKSVTDLKPGVHSLLVGPKGSGTQYSMENLRKRATTTKETKESFLFFWTSTKVEEVHNGQYDGVGIKNAPYEEAFETVAKDPKSVQLVMMGGYSPFMQKMQDKYGDKIRLVPISGDKSFTKIKDKDGNQVYQKCTMQGSAFAKLLDNAASVETLCVQSVVVLSKAWFDKYGQTALDVFTTGWEFTKPEIARIQGTVHQ